MLYLVFGAGIVAGVAICVVGAFVMLEATTPPKCMACGGPAHDHAC